MREHFETHLVAEDVCGRHAVTTEILSRVGQTYLESRPEDVEAEEQSGLNHWMLKHI
jgi:hypothetical protein